MDTNFTVGQYVLALIGVHNGVAQIVRRGDLVRVEGFENGRLIVSDALGARVLIDTDKVQANDCD